MRSSNDDGKVAFRWKDYRDGQQKTMALDAGQFIRRFLIHVLPSGFQRIRYFGFLGNRHRRERLALCRRLLGMPAAQDVSAGAAVASIAGDEPEDTSAEILRLTGFDPLRCPVCSQGTMQPSLALEPILARSR